MQILEQAVKATNSIDDGKLADYMHKSTFKTVVGDIAFSPEGEWAKPRILLVQYQNVVGNDVEQFKQAGKQVIIYPPESEIGQREDAIRRHASLSARRLRSVA